MAHFRRPLADGGANYLVATDAAGEGINLQFCWLMVNYDVPWNPARLEQRMGRIHRYGQRHDPVVIVNLVAGETREGRVLKTLLDKLELIRKQLRSDKVFDVVGRLFENVSLKRYLEMAATDAGAAAAIDGMDGLLTAGQVRALAERERKLFGGGEVESSLPALQAAIDREQYRRLLPGYAGDARAAAELARIKDEQRRLAAGKDRRLRLLQTEPSRIAAGDAEVLAHALVLPTTDTGERRRHDARVEEIAMRVAEAHEEASGATVQDVSRPELARRVRLGDRPGFDLLSLAAAGGRRAIEVKGRAGAGDIELSDNEWAAACNLRGGYWLYAVYDCATPRPRVVRVRDPFGKLVARSRALSAYAISAAAMQAAAEVERRDTP